MLFALLSCKVGRLSSSHQLVVKDAARQLFGRILSALFGFVITKIIASYL
ncbi:MAG: hypothetical protein LBP53_03385 [Candidatus Peribacteria bacterium]|nr:hypothetical protein [Candidatus Peribacteria bacterium]